MDIDALLHKMVKLRASDLHISTGYPAMVRIDGDLEKLDESALTGAQLAELVHTTLDPHKKAVFEENWEVDYAYQVEGLGRFRVNAFQQERGMAASFRYISNKIPSYTDLHAPVAFNKISEMNKGLVIVSGPTGSGKSTSLAAMVEQLNKDRKKHIITIEDPIEYLYGKGKCLVNQRELDAHTKSFANALRSALREDPDILLVGEMRDLETMRLALTAAETGHVVFSTLHTSSATSAISRIVDVFEGGEKMIIRSMLAESLQAIICQQLLRRKAARGRIAAFEILLATDAVRNIIRENKPGQLETVMQTNTNLGMQTFKKSLDDLKAQGLIA
jgi:twitching motility protein PilT